MSLFVDKGVDSESKKNVDDLFERISFLLKAMLRKRNLEKGFRVEMEKIMKGLL